MSITEKEETKPIATVDAGFLNLLLRLSGRMSRTFDTLRDAELANLNREMMDIEQRRKKAISEAIKALEIQEKEETEKLHNSFLAQQESVKEEASKPFNLPLLNLDERRETIIKRCEEEKQELIDGNKELGRVLDAYSLRK